MTSPKRGRGRQSAQSRLDDVVQAGAVEFAQRGYRRTQMADVARRIGISPGNLYNYVDSKDALFHLVLRRVMGERPGDQALELPVRGANVAITSKWLAKRLDFVSDFPQLEEALTKERSLSQEAELDAVTGELYDVLARMRLGVDMINQSVEDLPDLARAFARVREQLFARYARYLEQRARGGTIRAEDPRVEAHLLVELCSWAAGRRPNDPLAASISDEAARRAVCRFVRRALIPTDPPARKSTRREESRK